MGLTVIFRNRDFVLLGLKALIFFHQVHTSEIQSEVQNEMLKYVCKEYKGPKPAACQNLSRMSATKIDQEIL